MHTLLLAIAASAPAQVAVTEFLNDPDGTDMGREWVELFNFSRRDVPLAGWTLTDEDTDVTVLPDVVLGPGQFVVVVSGGIGGLDSDTAAAVFTTEWLGGTAGPVTGATGMALANVADEIVLRDATGAVVWSLAWADDEAATRATFLTSSADFSVSVYGSQAEPGIVRAGPDNGEPGFAGYEQNDATPDPFAYESDVSLLEAIYGEAFASVELPSVGSPLLGPYQVVPAGDINWDGRVDAIDMFALLAAWGGCPDSPWACPGDLDGDGLVGFGDFAILIDNLD